MTEAEIRKDIIERVSKFPTEIIDGREFVVIEGIKFPKDWFIEHCVRMKIDGEI